MEHAEIRVDCALPGIEIGLPGKCCGSYLIEQTSPGPTLICVQPNIAIAPQALSLNIFKMKRRSPPPEIMETTDIEATAKVSGPSACRGIDEVLWQH